MKNFTATIEVTRTIVQTATIPVPVQGEGYGDAQASAEAAAATAAVGGGFTTISSEDATCISSISYDGPVVEAPAAAAIAGLPEGSTDLAPAYLPGVEREDGSTYWPVAREKILVD